MTTATNTPMPTPTEMLDDVIRAVQDFPSGTVKAWNKWHFAVGVLFALSVTNQIDTEAIGQYEARVQGESQRLNRNPA